MTPEERAGAILKAMKRSVNQACVLLALLLMGSSLRACWLRPAECCPSYRVLTAEAQCLSCQFMPFARVLDRIIQRSELDHPVPMALAGRLISLEEDVQHVNAETLLQVEPPCRVQREIEKIRAELCELRADWCRLEATWSPSGH